MNLYYNLIYMSFYIEKYEMYTECILSFSILFNNKNIKKSNDINFSNNIDNYNNFGKNMYRTRLIFVLLFEK